MIRIFLTASEVEYLVIYLAIHMSSLELQSCPWYNGLGRFGAVKLHVAMCVYLAYLNAGLFFFFFFIFYNQYK